MTAREILKSRRKRAERNEVYNQLRTYFEVLPVQKGIFKRRIVGWVIHMWRVEDWSMAAPMGSTGWLVDHEISEQHATKFAAYRWLLNEVTNLNELEYLLFWRDV